MKFARWMVAGSLLLAGCSSQANTAAISPAASNASDSPAPSAAPGSSSTDTSDTFGSPGPSLTAPGTTDGQPTKVIKLTPANTKIQFIGTHVGPKPDPKARVGTFERFHGQAVLSDDLNSLQSVAVDIETGSLQAMGGKLTNHLNSDDFLDTRSHPTATFKSKRIEKDDQGETQIIGDLTLHGVTKEVSIPANVTIDEQGLSLKGELTIDRTEFGMDRQLEAVNKEVDITVTIGKTAYAAGDGRRAPFPLAE